MAIQSNLDNNDKQSEEFVDDFKAKAIMLVKNDSKNIWEEKEVTICSRDCIRELFKPYDVTQINISKYMKVYIAIDFLSERSGVDGRAKSDIDTFLLVSPILLVYCNDTNPIDITDDILAQFKEQLELY